MSGTDLRASSSATMRGSLPLAHPVGLGGTADLVSKRLATLANLRLQRSELFEHGERHHGFNALCACPVGSARLDNPGSAGVRSTPGKGVRSWIDTYRRGGDSMVGRFHLWHLHPFSLGEHPISLDAAATQSRLLRVGGFPEPFVKNDERFARRWRLERHSQILREDIRDLERVDALVQMEQLLELLQHRVGSPIVVSNLAADLELAPRTVSRYLDVLARSFLCFIVPTYTAKLARAIRKPPKVFFYDNADVIGDDGARFENLVVLRDRKVAELWEVKLHDVVPSAHLRYYAERLKPTRAVQVVSQGGIHHDVAGIELRSAAAALRFDIRLE